MQMTVSRKLLTACTVLFGPEVEVSGEFLQILQPSGVQAAFRRRARETHPDLAGTSPERQQQQALLFHEVTDAYHQLTRFCQLRALARRPVTSSASSRSFRKGSPPEQQSPPPTLAVMPQHAMPLGRFLLSRHLVSYPTLLAALTWQRRQRPAIGQLAISFGWLNREQVIRVLADCASFGRFGEKAQQLGLLTPFQVKTLLFGQRQRQRPLGEYFVSQGYLTRRQLANALTELQEHNCSRFKQ